MNGEVNEWILQLVPHSTGSRSEKLSQSKTVLRSLIANFTRTHCRLVMGWDCDLQLLIGRSSRFIILSERQQDDDILRAWKEMVQRMEGNWRDIVGANFVLSEELDEDDQVEHQLMDGDDLDDNEVEENFEELEVED